MRGYSGVVRINKKKGASLSILSEVLFSQFPFIISNTHARFSIDRSISKVEEKKYRKKEKIRINKKKGASLSILSEALFSQFPFHYFQYARFSIDRSISKVEEKKYRKKEKIRINKKKGASLSILSEALFSQFPFHYFQYARTILDRSNCKVEKKNIERKKKYV